MESAPTGVCGIAGFACSRLVTGLAPVRRGGIYPARGCLRRREVRGTMRASSPTEVCGVVKFVVSRLAASFSPVCRGGPWPSRGCSRRREVRGTIFGLRAGPCGPVGLRNAPAGAVQASSPTEVCYNAGSRFPGRLPCFPRSVGRAFTPAAPPQIQKTCSGGHFFKDRLAAGSSPLPCGARQTLYRQETNAFLNRLTHPQNGWVFCARRRALVFRRGSR